MSYLSLLDCKFEQVLSYFQHPQHQHPVTIVTITFRD